MTPKAWREAVKLTKEQAAELLGTHPASVAKYERGDPVDTRRLAERFSARTGGLVSIVEWMFPAGHPRHTTLTPEEADARSQDAAGSEVSNQG